MISSAHICYNSKHNKLTLPNIAEHLREKISWKVSMTEWWGYGITVPQLLVHTPIPFLVQIEDDPDWVIEEIQEIIERENLDPSSELAQRISHCDTRLAIQPTTPDQIISDGSSITVSTLGMAIDPADTEISGVLEILRQIVDGITYDSVNGGITTL